MSNVIIYIDGKKTETSSDLSVREAALQNGIYVPGLCSHPELDQFKAFNWSEQVWQGSESHVHQGDSDFPHCNLCLVSINGGVPERSCTASVSDGLKIRTTGDDLISARKTSLKKILEHHPHACLTCAQQEGCSRTQCSMNVAVEDRCCELLGRCEIGKVSGCIGIPVDTPSYSPRGLPVLKGEPLFIRDFELCINCLRCVRICRDVREIDILGAVNSDQGVRVGTQRGPTLVEAMCRFCGACVEVCPTGALRDHPGTDHLIDGKAPCVSACPLEIDVPGYIDLISRGLEHEALDLIREKAVLPGVLGYACFHPCEDSCRRGCLDASASICALKRYVADVAGDEPFKVNKPEMIGQMIAVIGSGPAGLAAAAELLIRGYDVTIFERDGMLGGMLRQSIPGFRLPEQVLERDLNHIINLGLRSELNVEFGVDYSIQSLKRDGFAAVIIAVGMAEALKLNVPGEKLQGVLHGLDFLRQVRQGGTISVSGRVVVIGGGSVAVDTAMTARRLGAEKVTVVCLESPEEMPASREEIETMAEEGIEIHNRWGVREITGKNGVGAQVILKCCTSVFDKQLRFSPQYDSTVTTTLPFENLIVSIGQRLPDKLKELTQSGEPGVYIAGDCSTGPATIVEAMADGKRVAGEADLVLGGLKPSSGEDRPENKTLAFDSEFHKRMRVNPLRKSAEIRVKSFDLFESTFTNTEAVQEAARCLKCHLRSSIKAIPMPPDLWKKFSPELAAEIPVDEGVLIFSDDEKQVVKILGSGNLSSAFTDLIEDEYAASFVKWELDPMYTQRESELLQTHLQEHGELPGADDLDDLF